jgi:N-acetylglucosamine kinase-like BadF-type ATPase
VDAGGSRTVAALARGERVLRTIAGSGANPNVLGIDAAADAIARCIERLLDGESPAAIGAGVAGAGDESVRARLLAVLKQRFPVARIAISHDARIALRAAIPQGDGIVVIAGTGSIAYAEIGERSFFAGGYGYLFGDAGSGYAIGAEALRNLLAALEAGVPERALPAELASHLGANDRSVLLGRIYGSATPVADIGACAPIVIRHAADGDDLANVILGHAIDGLFELISRIVDRCAKSALPLAFAGGLLRERNALTDRLEQRIADAALDVRIVAARAEPYLGALAEARRLVGCA